MDNMGIYKKKLLFLVLFLLLLHNTILAKSLVNGLSSIIENNHELQAISNTSTNTIFVPTHPALAIDSNENLFLTYRENYQDYSSIVMLRTIEDNEYYVWNLTKNYLYIPDDNDLITSYPAMIFHQDNFYLGITSRNETMGFFKILEISSSTLESTTLLELNSTDSLYLNPKIGVTDQTLWFSWLNNDEEHYNLYYTKYNQTSASCSSIVQLSNDTYGNCQNSELFLDNNGSCHFVWSQGLEYQNYIFYECLLENQTSYMNSTVVGNISFSVDPDIIIEANGQVNIFWSNYTVIPPIILGTINIQYCTYSEANNWSEIKEVAPYIAIDKTPMIDGENPDTTIDSNNILWMVYELVEPYPQITGIAIRGRQNGWWLDGEPVTRGITPAYDPCIVSDNSGNIHCVWLDFRIMYFEIYYMARFANGLWSTEQQLTKYYLPANLKQGPILIGVFFGAIVIMVILIPAITHRVKSKRMNKLLEEHKKEIIND